MNRHIHLRKEAESSLKAICQLVRSRRQRHERCSDDQIDHTDRHDCCVLHTLVRDLGDSKGEDCLSWSQNQIKDTSHHQQNYNAFQASYHEGEGDLGEANDSDETESNE